MIRPAIALMAWSILLDPALLAEESVRKSGSSSANVRTGGEPSRVSHIVVVRVSSDVLRLRDREKAQVAETSRVDEVVLGMRAVGTARAWGELSMDFFPDRDDTGLWLNLTGTTVARTVSRSGPAMVHTVVTSRFHCRKPILFGLENGFRYGQATSNVQVVSMQQTVQPTVGGLRGRLVRRVAERRISAVRGYLICVAERNTKRRIESQFDREANVRLTALNKTFHALRLALQSEASRQEDQEYDVSLNTTDRYLQIGVGPKGVPNPRLPDAEVPDLPLQVWLHTSIFGEEAAPLLKNWEHLRFLLPTPTNLSGLTSALRIEQPDDAEEKIPVQLVTSLPWVVITAGRAQESSAAVPGIGSRTR